MTAKNRGYSGDCTGPCKKQLSDTIYWWWVSLISTALSASPDSVTR
jgi:hypothetical protein